MDEVDGLLVVDQKCVSECVIVIVIIVLPEDPLPPPPAAAIACATDTLRTHALTK